MGTNAGPVAETGETKRPELPDIQILNEIHWGMGQVMRGHAYESRMPRWVFLGRNQYRRLLESTFLVFSAEMPNHNGEYHATEFVMGVEIVRVDRDEFLAVV
jgi:hypothetical protein